MRIFFDTEFLEDGKTIDLISIGMVREDGEELYLVNQEADWKRIDADAWLSANVVPALGTVQFVTRTVIASKVVEFAGDAPEFWAYYADYDWVVLCQLFGRMLDLPKGWPMYCRDFKQRIDERGWAPRKQVAGEHNALEDARWLRDEYDNLSLEEPGTTREAIIRTVDELTSIEGRRALADAKKGEKSQSHC